MPQYPAHEYHRIVETALFLFNLRFVDWPNPPFQHPEKCDNPVIGTHSLVPFLNREIPVCHSFGTVPDSHTMLNRGVNQDSPSTLNFQHFCLDLIIPGALPLRRCLATSVTSTREIDDEPPSTSSSVSIIEGVLVRFRSS